MKIVNRYVSDDGFEFVDQKSCEKHERLVRQVNAIMSGINSREKLYEDQYLQHYRYSFMKTKGDIFAALCYEVPDLHVTSSMISSIEIPYHIGRTACDLGGPINSAIYRFQCVDENLREWEQPYFAANNPSVPKRANPIENDILIISGGQTGADQAGWRAAKAVGFKTGGWMPARYKTEDGNRPEMNLIYNAKETEEDAGYRERTLRNFSDSECTILFGNPNSPGGKLVQSLFRERSLMVSHDPYEKKLIYVLDSNEVKPRTVADLIKSNGFIKINIAGNRESKSPGIGKWVELWLTEMFSIMKEIM